VEVLGDSMSAQLVTYRVGSGSRQVSEDFTVAVAREELGADVAAASVVAVVGTGDVVCKQSLVGISPHFRRAIVCRQSGCVELGVDCGGCWRHFDAVDKREPPSIHLKSWCETLDGVSHLIGEVILNETGRAHKFRNSIRLLLLRGQLLH